jgi:hypothetical protein
MVVMNAGNAAVRAACSPSIDSESSITNKKSTRAQPSLPTPGAPVVLVPVVSATVVFVVPVVVVVVPVVVVVVPVVLVPVVGSPPVGAPETGLVVPVASLALPSVGRAGAVELPSVALALALVTAVAEPAPLKLVLTRPPSSPQDVMTICATNAAATCPRDGLVVMGRRYVERRVEVTALSLHSAPSALIRFAENGVYAGLSGH